VVYGSAGFGLAVNLGKIVLLVECAVLPACVALALHRLYVYAVRKVGILGVAGSVVPGQQASISPLAVDKAMPFR